MDKIKISNKHFYQLWSDALDWDGEMVDYVSDHALGWEQSTDDPYAEPIDVESEEFAQRVDFISQVWDVAHMSIRDMCKAADMTQAAFAQKFCVPLRTLENWCRNRRQCPDYIRLMIAELLGIISK